MRPLLVPLLLISAALFGCTVVHPWEREHLARYKDMQWDPDPLDAALHSHIHFSKEGSIAGGSGGGGGCGCN